MIKRLKKHYYQRHQYRKNLIKKLNQRFNNDVN